MAKFFIKAAIKHPGALHRQLGVPQGQKIPPGKLAAAAAKGGTLGKRARLAQTLRKMHHSPRPFTDEVADEVAGSAPLREEYMESGNRGTSGKGHRFGPRKPRGYREPMEHGEGRMARGKFRV